jgi:hypothetical protein
MSGEVAPQVTSGLTTGVHRFFGRLKTPLYAIVDTAQDRKALSLLEESDCRYEILYPQRFALAMDCQGPHLVSVSPNSCCLERLINAGWGNRCGIYLAGPDDFAAVRRHLRRLLFVKLKDGPQVLFRFYDPRVLRDYLPTCNDDELEQFFGQLTAVYLESEDGQRLCTFQWIDRGR